MDMRSPRRRRLSPPGLRCAGALCSLGLLPALIPGCAEQASRTAWLGINPHLAADHNPSGGYSPTTGAEQAQCFRLLADLGVPLVRDRVMNWGEVQPDADARLRFDATDLFIKQAQDADADMLAVFMGTPAWASGGAAGEGLPGRDQEKAFRAFVTAFVERYDGDGRGDMRRLKRRVRAYEFLDEAYEVPTADYAFWMRAFYEAVKAADHSAVVLVGGLRSPGVRELDGPVGSYESWFERLLAEESLQGDRFPFFDVVSFHSFPDHLPGREQFQDSLAYIRRVLNDHRLVLPIWLTEYGFDGGPGRDERQAEEVVKAAIRARGMGIDRVYLAALRDGSAETAGPQVGLVRESADGGNPSTKPAFHAFSFLLQQLRKNPQVVFIGPGRYALTGKAEPLLVLWDEDVYDPSPTEVPGWWEMQLLNGPPIVKQGPKIKLISTPLFLRRVPSPFMQ